MNRPTVLSFVFIVFGSITLYTHPGVASPKPNCERLMVGPIMSKIIERNEVLLTNAGALCGLPSSETYSVRTAVPDSPDEVDVDTNLGLSRWKVNELCDWLALSALMKNPVHARRQMTLIIDRRGYCPRGLLPELCQSLRDSRALHQKAITQTTLQKTGDKSKRQREITVRRYMQAVEVLHETSGTIPFGWGQETGLLSLELSADQMTRVFAILSRESLVRHLQFTGLDGKIRYGSSLPLGSRLAAALVPGAAALLPFFEIFPPHLPENFSLGDGTEDLKLSLVEMALENPSRILPILHVELDIDAEPLAAVEAYVNWSSDASAHDRRLLQFEVEAQMNDYGKVFQQIVNLERTPQFRSMWDHDLLYLTPSGMTSHQQLLFYYFLAERYAWRKLAHTPRIFNDEKIVSLFPVRSR